MPPFPPGPVGPVGPQGPIGPVGPAGGLQAYVSYGGNLGTVTTGTTLPLTPIVAEGQNFITTSGNSIVLAPGDYEVIYSFAGTTEGTDTFFTVTPSVNNVPQALYSATNTDTSGTGGANTVGNAFIVSSATASTLNFALTTDSTTGITDSAFTVTVKKLDS